MFQVFLYRFTLLRFQPCRAGPGYVFHREGSFPHRRELVEALAREYPPQDEVTSLEHPRTDVADVVATQPLLVPSRAEGSSTPSLLEEE